MKPDLEALIIKPRKSIELVRNSHFFKLIDGQLVGQQGIQDGTVMDQLKIRISSKQTDSKMANERLENLIHKPCEGARCNANSKQHDLLLIKPLPYFKSRLPYVSGLIRVLKVSRPQIHLEKTWGPTSLSNKSSNREIGNRYLTVIY